MLVPPDLRDPVLCEVADRHGIPPLPDSPTDKEAIEYVTRLTLAVTEDTQAIQRENARKAARVRAAERQAEVVGRMIPGVQLVRDERLPVVKSRRGSDNAVFDGLFEGLIGGQS